jgi:hypothetical protein
MVVYQFVIMQGAAAAPLKSYITHQFSGKRVRLSLIKIHAAMNVSEELQIPTIPFRLDLEGLVTNVGTAFYRGEGVVSLNTAGLVSNSTGFGIFIPNRSHDSDFHGLVKMEGYCLGNAWAMGLQAANLAPNVESTINDIFENVDHVIVTVDVEEI